MNDELWKYRRQCAILLFNVQVLLVGSKDFTLIGCPLLDNELVRVEATVIEKTLSYTKLHFKMVKRENYRRLKCKFQKKNILWLFIYLWTVSSSANNNSCVECVVSMYNFFEILLLLVSRFPVLKTPYSMLRINLIQLMQPLNMIEKSDFEESAVAAATQQHQSTITV